jgi:hypothetical protein
VYKQTAEWWDAACLVSGKRHADMPPKDLMDAHPGYDSHTWGQRRMIGKQKHKGVSFGEVAVGGAAQAPKPKEPKEPKEPPIELTTEEKIERDKTINRLMRRVEELQAKYDEALRGNEIEDRMCSAIDSRIPSMPPVPLPSFKRASKHRPETAVMLVSDYHIGEYVSGEETGGINHYDFDTFARRWQYHVDSVGGICFGKLTGYDLPRLSLVGLGDMVSGTIHDELVETSDSTLMDWLIDGSSILAQGIRQLAAEFGEVKIDWHFGNHGRVTQKPRFKRRWVNYDYLLGHMISLHLAAQSNVTFVNHKSFWSLVDMEGFNLLNLHGDNIRGWNGIPAYGINRAVSNLTALLNSRQQRFQVVNLAHFHQTALLERTDCDVVLNGSGIGANEFSIGALFAGAKPRQVLYGMHPEKGRTWQYAIDLSDGDSKPCRYPV